MASTGNILTVVTNVDQYDRVGFRTGLWLGELTHFLDAVEEHGFQCEIASPSGGWVPLDPQGLMIPEMGHNSRLGTASSARSPARPEAGFPWIRRA